jgi:hypothetical protein
VSPKTRAGIFSWNTPLAGAGLAGGIGSSANVSDYLPIPSGKTTQLFPSIFLKIRKKPNRPGRSPVLIDLSSQRLLLSQCSRLGVAIPRSREKKSGR